MGYTKLISRNKRKCKNKKLSRNKLSSIIKKLIKTAIRLIRVLIMNQILIGTLKLSFQMKRNNKKILIRALIKITKVQFCKMIKISHILIF